MNKNQSDIANYLLRYKKSISIYYGLMNNDQFDGYLKGAKAKILEAEVILSELEPELEKILSFKTADIKDWQKMKRMPEKAIDVCIGINWLIKPINHNDQFGDWK